METEPLGDVRRRSSLASDSELCLSHVREYQNPLSLLPTSDLEPGDGGVDLSIAGAKVVERIEY